MPEIATERPVDHSLTFSDVPKPAVRGQVLGANLSHTCEVARQVGVQILRKLRNRDTIYPCSAFRHDFGAAVRL
jgi:hypothetical protein